MEKLHRIAFLDRDGVINKKAADHEYIYRIDDFKLNDGIIEVLTNLKQKGYEFIIITNQRGVARGLYSSSDVDTIHKHLRNQLKREGVEVLDIFYCPHENGVCECRKPKDGMLREATSKYAIDIPRSLLISDSKEDVVMGNTFGIGTNILVPSDDPKKALTYL